MNFDGTRESPPALSSGDAWEKLSHTSVGECAKIFIWEKDATGFAAKTKREINTNLKQIAIVEAVEMRRQQGDAQRRRCDEVTILVHCPNRAPSIKIIELSN